MGRRLLFAFTHSLSHDIHNVQNPLLTSRNKLTVGLRVILVAFLAADIHEAALALGFLLDIRKRASKECFKNQAQVDKAFDKFLASEMSVYLYLYILLEAETSRFKYGN